MFQHLRDIRRIAGQDRPTGAEIEKKLQGQDSGTEFLQRLKRRRDEQDGGGENVFAERGFSLPGNDTDIRHRSGPRLNRPVTVGADEQEGEVRQLLCSLDHDVQALFVVYPARIDDCAGVPQQPDALLRLGKWDWRLETLRFETVVD
jgi:hypothetical protein